MEYTIQSQPSYSLLEATLSQRGNHSGGVGGDDVDERRHSNDDLHAGRCDEWSGQVGTGRGELFPEYVRGRRRGGGMVGLAPGQPGDIVAHEMTVGHELFLEKSAYLASDEDVKINSDFQGLRGLFNEGLFILRASGSGTLFFNSYGDVEEVEVDGSYRVDNGHAVAWEPTLDYEITRGGRGIRSFLFSDQLILRFTGHGKLWVQSRNPRSLASWVFPFRPQSSSGGN